MIFVVMVQTRQKCFSYRLRLHFADMNMKRPYLVSYIELIRQIHSALLTNQERE